jgi:hypothetical protein
MVTANRQRSSRADHLRPHWFRKGQSGNPNGRPKRKPIEEALVGILTMPDAVLVAKAIIRAAKHGNVKAFNSLADRVDGKVPQPVAVTGGNGGPLVIEIRDIGSKNG